MVETKDGVGIDRRFLLGLGAALLLPGRMARAGEGPALPPGLTDIGTGKVAEVVDGDTVRLAGGKQVRFVGTQAPKLPLGRPGYPTWPLGPEAKAHLATLCAGRRVRLFAGGARQDRHGRILAHLVTEEGLWLQGAMLEAGLARVYTFKDNRALAAEMLALEAAARAAALGLWADATYRIRKADETDLLAAVDKVPGYLLVEGRVLRSAAGGGRWFLNFGRDHANDFTASIAASDLPLFTAAGIDPATYAGKTLRLRGWLEARNGPAMTITHPEQIEVG
ncbi:thermonuclease family protein [Zavarzinia aquatilis]|uniref:Nuclease (SNase) n=1 Tax=Zavarzinia aquatilis TaxID=2211142 RepID=A0A317E599_9PROT|nr:thermonuclease family protein [Zavarzinia aquatilis]PWR21346.1 nuclease (SNase) [Zavarzinia aquatilis]